MEGAMGGGTNIHGSQAGHGQMDTPRACVSEDLVGARGREGAVGPLGAQWAWGP